MTNKLPRVTYTNQNTDFTEVENHFDDVLKHFEKNTLGKEYGHIINNKEIRNVWPNTAYKINSPIDGTLIGTFYDCVHDVSSAVHAAKDAQKTWGALKFYERIVILRKIAEELDKQKYNLAAAALFEVGKNRMEAIGEAEEVVDFVSYYCNEYEKNNGYHTTMKSANPKETAESVMLPFGVFGVITPFNFPLAMSINMIVGAILTGNTVIWKPTKINALSSYLLLKAMIKAGLPEGVVNLLNGGDEVGKVIVNHPEINGVTFTGSNKVGMEIIGKMHNGGKYARPAIVEMGGKNPSYICETADLSNAAQGVVRSAFGMNGQKCSANSKVYVHESIYKEFLNLLKSYTSLIKIGDVRDRRINLGPVINKISEERFKSTITQIIKDGGNIEIGGEILGDISGYCEPTIVTNLPMNHDIMRTELFVPILVVQKFSDLKDAINSGNDVLYGLTSGIYSKNKEEIEYFYNNAENGVKYVNRASGSTTGTWPGTTSFVGWKGTGSGSGKGGLGPNYLVQFLKEQCRVEYFGE